MPEPTVPQEPDTAIEMRALIGADLAHAHALLDQAHASAPFARLKDPSDTALFRGLLSQACVMANRAHAMLVDATFDTDRAA